jgi:hypothetical protein
MLTLQTILDVKGLSGRQVTDFLLNCDDERYQKWWEGTHLQFHTIKRCPNNIGNVVYMDEYVGQRRLKMQAIVIKAAPGKEVVWQMKKGFRLPAWLALTVDDIKGGVRIKHTITAGFKGIGKILDPLFGLYLSKEFEKAVDEHARIEFPKLREMV